MRIATSLIDIGALIEIIIARLMRVPCHFTYSSTDDRLVAVTEKPFAKEKSGDSGD